MSTIENNRPFSAVVGFWSNRHPPA